MQVVISGYYGFANAGDEAILAAMIQSFKQLDPSIRLIVLSGDPAETERSHGVDALDRLNYPALAAALARSQLLISGGGSLLQDVTSRRSIYYYLSILFMAQQLRVPIMFYAQGVGPVRNAFARGAIRHLASKADLITLRDRGSYEELKALGIHEPPTYVTADPVLALTQPDLMEGQALLQQAGLDLSKPLVGLSVRFWSQHKAYFSVLARFCDELVRGYDAQIVFFPMQYARDIQAAHLVTAQMTEQAVVLEARLNTVSLLSLVGSFDLVLGIRLHALLFACLMGVPFMGLSYDPKIDRFLDSLGEKPVGHLASLDLDLLRNALHQRWPYGQRLTKAGQPVLWAAKGKELKMKAFYNAELALRLLYLRQSAQSEKVF